MITITMEQWNRISQDYKSEPTAGVRECFAGCLPGGQGTDIWTEGVDFQIAQATKPAVGRRPKHKAKART